MVNDGCQRVPNIFISVCVMYLNIASDRPKAVFTNSEAVPITVAIKV